MLFDFTVRVPYAVFSVEYVSVHNLCGRCVLE